MTFEKMPLRRVFQIFNGGTPTSNERNWNGELAWATPADLSTAHGKVLHSTARAITRAGLAEGSQSVPANSLILATRAPIGYVCETGSRMAFNQGCRGLVPHRDVDSRFFRYQLSVMAEQFQALGQGSTFMELRTEALAATLVAVPTLPEQQAIADYLDTETARIDALISKKRHLIKLLAEYRTTLITQTVTHGLNRSAASDGAAFEELPVGRVFQIVNGGTPTSKAENWNGEIAWATPVDLATAHGKVLSSTARTITGAGLREGSRSVPSNSLILSTRAPIGYVCENATPMAFNQGCRGLIPRQRLDSRYFRYQFSVMGDQLQALGQGSTFMELHTNSLATANLAVPTLAEQRAIADYLDTETDRIDAVSSREESVIKLLEEYRAALITAAVTGQLAVPAS